MVIKIDAGIGKALALEDELVVATEKPAAVQCIRWAPTSPEDQTITEIINRVPWLNKKNTVIDLVYDRAMSLFLWITNDGKAYAVQRITSDAQRTEGQGKYFRGHEFHAPQGQGTVAVKAAINARFSLLAIGCANGEIYVYVARDYVGSLPLSHKLKAPAPYAITGNITFLSFSPDGYCLIAGYEHGWVMWSVYGKLGGSSFTSDRSVSEECDERWLLGVIDGTWISNGAEVLLIAKNDDRLWALEVARSAVTSCFNPANVSRMLIHTNSMVMVYRGYDSSNIMSLSSDASLWSQIQIPATFLSSQSPLRCAVISPDGRYVAVAGRRGLAHYSFQSGRWKVFDNPHTENSFLVRGGMCWYQHILIVAVETDTEDEVGI